MKKKNRQYARKINSIRREMKSVRKNQTETLEVENKPNTVRPDKVEA